MNKTAVKLLLAIVLLLSPAVAVPVFAQEGADSDTSVSNQTTTDTDSEKTREQRIQQRKDKLERRLTQAQLTTVRRRCEAAAGLVKANQARIKSFTVKRTQVYGGLVERLEALSPKLQAAGVDTTAYDEQVEELKSKAEAYETAIDSLQHAVDDLVDMDCTADPEGFVATQQEAIRLRTDVIAKGQDFRTYLKDTFKPTFTDIRTQLQAKRESEE